MHRLMSSLPAYACHVTQTWSHDTLSTMEESCFQQKFSEKKTTIYYSAPTFFLSRRNPANSTVGLKKLDDKGSQKSARFFAGAGHVTSQISTQLPASRSPRVTGSADKK